MMSNKVQDTSAHDDLASYDTSKYAVVELDSNEQSAVTTGGEDHLVVRDGGSDLGYQEGQGFGGRALG